MNYCINRAVSISSDPSLPRCSLLITMPLLNKACIAQALAYAVAVSVAGGDAYESAQDAACVWEPCCCDEQ